jgi:hypothetical protein
MGDLLHSQHRDTVPNQSPSAFSLAALTATCNSHSGLPSKFTRENYTAVSDVLKSQFI